MAWSHVQAVRELALPPIPRLLMLMLALRANEDGICWPSIAKLCRDTGLARRTVQLHLARFRDQRLIVREERPGRVPCIRLLIGVCSTGAPMTPVRSETGTGVTGASDAPQTRTICAPPARRMHPPAHDSRVSSARDAPEVNKEYLPKLFEKKNALTRPNLVDKSSASEAGLDRNWWKTDAGIARKGHELGIPARPGETFGEYRDRLFAADRTRSGSATASKVNDVPHQR
jgi:hypothetical protein